MKRNMVAYITLVMSLTGLVSGCGQEESSEFSANTSQSGGTSHSQYIEPTVEVLKGKEQPYPASYPVSKYPKSKVTYAWVKPDLLPGYKNHVMLSVPEPSKDTIAQYYKTELKKGGWKMVDRWENTIYSSTIWQKDGQEVEVRVSPDQHNNQNVQLFAGPIFKKRYAPHA